MLCAWLDEGDAGKLLLCVAKRERLSLKLSRRVGVMLALCDKVSRMLSLSDAMADAVKDALWDASEMLATSEAV